MNENIAAPDPEQIKEMEPEELLKQFDRLIKKISNRYATTAARYGWIDVSDLQQVASIALLDAQATFETSKEASFMTYAYNVMKWAILKTLKARWTQDGIRYEPTPVSLDEPINEEGETTRGDLIPGTDPPLEELAEKADLSDRVRAAVNSLPDDQTEVIERLYLNEPTETRKHIAEEKSLPAHIIKGKEEKAFRKLKRDLWYLRPETPYHIGLLSFNTKWISEPELYVISQEDELERRIEQRKQFMKEATGREIDP